VPILVGIGKGRSGVAAQHNGESCSYHLARCTIALREINTLALCFTPAFTTRINIKLTVHHVD